MPSEEARGLLGRGDEVSKPWNSCQKCCACACCVFISIAVVIIVTLFSCTVGFAMTTQCVPVVKENDGEQYIAWWNMPVCQSMALQKELQAKATPLNATEQAIFDAAAPAIWNGQSVWGKASAETMIDIMYRGTHIDGVVEKVPEKFRGVFWMRDNGAPEELVVLQYSRYFKEANTLIMPMAPFMWSWPRDVPPGAPYEGLLYEVAGLNGTVQAAMGLTGQPVTLSYKLGPCPSGAKYCDPGDSDDTAFATMQSHNKGDLLSVANMGNLIDAILEFIAPGNPIPKNKFTGSFTLQEMNGVKRGSLYKRTCQWGIGRCDWAEFGSYDLTKIIDGDGKKIQPYYNDFIKYMGDDLLFGWLGFKSQKAMDEIIQEYKKEAEGGSVEL